jgi:predicted nucleic acid-binding protein
VIAYLDASVVLRLVLREPKPLAEWKKLTGAVASALTEVECLRTLDRLTRAGALSGDGLAERRAAVYDLLGGTEVVDIGRTILKRASEQFPTPLGTLDAIHLATAIAWRDFREQELLFATHDRLLGTAARAMGFRVSGT